jgi:hypothetical protein
VALASVSCVALAGCGGGHSSTEPTAKLARAIYPSCGVDKFRTPTTGPAVGRAGGWEVVYQFPVKPPRPPRPGETTVVDLVEEPPVAHRVRLKGGHDVTIAGRQVSLVPGQGFKSSVAEWTTTRARYIIIANGNKDDTYKRVIGCLP